MTTATIKHFDVLAYVKKAKEFGVKEEFAEFQARQIEQLADIIQEQRQEIEGLKQSEPASRKDLDIVKLELQKEIRDIESRLIRWIIATGITGIVIMAGLIKYMIH